MTEPKRDDHESRTGHPTTWDSPNGVDKIEECFTCGARILYNPCIGYPITLDPLPVSQWDVKAFFDALDAQEASHD